MEGQIVDVTPDFLSEINHCESLEEYVTVGLQLARQKTISQWFLGLLALRVETSYGEQSLHTFAKSINVSASSLMVYRWTCKAFLETDSSFVPPEKLSFSTLQAVAKLPPPERQSFLTRADDEDMSVERVRREVHESTGAPHKPRFSLVYCTPHAKWHFIPQNPELWEPAHEI